MIGINTSFGTPAHADKHAFNATVIREYGYECIRFDGGFPDSYGTPFNPPTPPTPNYSGLDAAFAAYSPLKIPILVVIYPVVPDTLSWSTAQGGSLCSVLARGASDALTQAIASCQLSIDRCRSKHREYGGLDEHLEFQWWNEIGIGGAGGPSAVASNHGKYDKYSDLAGTVSDPGYFREQATSLFSEGTVLTNANLDSMATSLSRADIADLWGPNEISAQFLGSLDFYGHTLVAPAFEHQVPPWGATSSPSALISTSTIAARERATYFPSSYGFEGYFDALSLNTYVGDNSAVGSCSPSEYAKWMRQMIIRSSQRIRRALPDFAGKPMWITECGLASPWVPSGTSSDKRGDYWRHLISMARNLPNIERVYMYRLRNHQVSEDSLSSNSNFGMYASDGTPFEGAIQGQVSTE